MKVRNAIAAVSVAALALSLAACTSDPAPTGDSPRPSATASDPATPSATQPSTATQPPAATQPPSDVTVREIQEGFDLPTVAKTLRTGFPSFAPKTDDEIVVILNAGCDAIAATGTPEAGADAIRTYGIEAYDAAFSLTASIQLYCPEYAQFLDRS